VPYPRGTKKQRVSEVAGGYAATALATTSGQHEYLSLLGLRSFDTASLLKRLDEGLSYGRGPDHSPHPRAKKESGAVRPGRI